MFKLSQNWGRLPYKYPPKPKHPPRKPWFLHGFRHISMEQPHLRMMFIDFPPKKKPLFLVDFSLQRLITKESIKGDGIYRHAHYLVSWAVELVQRVRCLHMFCPLNPDTPKKNKVTCFSVVFSFVPSFFLFFISFNSCSLCTC